MRTKRKLRPGEPGTKKYVEKYGDDLFCIRYRYDNENKVRYTTVELIIEKGPLKKNERKKPADDQIVFLKIETEEDALQEQVRLFGGKLNKKYKLWELDYKTVKELNLVSRIHTI